MKRIVCLLVMLAIAWQLILLPASAAGEYRTWLQSDSRWGSIAFGEQGDTVSKSGCAITSVAKLLVHSGAVADNEEQFNPGIYCRWLNQVGALTPQGWIVWSMASNYDADFNYFGAVNLTGTATQKTATIQSYYNDGYVIAVSVKNGGHYVAVDKVANNTVYIMDPANTGYTKLFQYDAAGVNQIQIYKGPHNGSGASSPDTPKYDTTIVPSGVGSYSITSEDGVNLRAGAGTSYDILTAIPYNTVVNVTKVKSGWGYTSYNGQNGWFSLEYGKLTVNTLRAVKVTVLPTKMTYQIGESFDPTGMVVRAYYADGSAKTLSSGYTVNEFSSAKAGSCDVYVTYKTKSFLITVTIEEPVYDYKIGYYKINTADGVNLRSSASATATVLATVPNKTSVNVTAIKNNWGKITYESQTGWICLDYAKLTATQTGIEVTVLTPCLLTDQTVTVKDFKVKRVYSDGTKKSLSAYTVRVASNLNEGRLPVRIIDGDFSYKLYIPVYDSVPAGDCNFDGQVTAADALGVLQYVVGKAPAVFYDTAADVDGNGNVNANDALQILRYVVGKITEFASS